MRLSGQTAGTTLHEDDAIRLWTLDDEVVIASIKTKMHAIGPDVIEGLLQGLALAEDKYKGLVIWSQRRDVLSRRRPAGHAARLHDGRCQGDLGLPSWRCSKPC